MPRPELRRVRFLAGRLRWLAVGTAVTAALVVAFGAGSSPSSGPPVSEVLSKNAQHGKAVSQAVHDPKATAKEAGEKVGPAVSEAACTAAHDRTTLPEGAQGAPGQQGRAPKDCTHPSHSDEDVPPQGPEDLVPEISVAEEKADKETHGAAVSQAVHEAKAAAKEAGEKVGPAVSEAACTAAHDRSTLPEGAQNAPGQQGREPKDCTHPSSAATDEDLSVDSDPSEKSEKARGKDAAPGQKKKQED